ncbi:hypothetical protein KM043_007123 [Ampulex compressa]|nr:hypothetical protein KM043_007123 [Ampulex compressa]
MYLNLTLPHISTYYNNCSGSIEDLEKNALASGIQSDTRRDYQALREKLGAEFHRKLVEWERLKGVQARANARSTSSTVGLGYRESSHLYEDRLAPEFKRKLQDWKRAKKGRRSSATVEQQQRFSRRRLTDWQLWRSPSKPESRNQDTIGSRGSCGSGGSAGSTASDSRPHLCEDFVRRMETWRRMNEATYRGGETKSRAAKRLPPGTLDETEFVPLEKVLASFGDRVEKERRESDARQLDECFDGDSRFLDGAQGMNCGNEILIRTSVGSYRFEGISREFTRKLYDWEKYRGISPRSSTFRLLGPGYTPFARGMNIEESMEAATTPETADEGKTFLGVLKRSKSVGSGIEGTVRNNPFIRRSTSLQLLNHLANKMDNDDRTDQSPAPMDSQRNEDASEDAIMDDSEPEAMIIDIEDVIEETASPLNRVQPHQTPVYSVAASETTSIAVPLGTVTSSHEPSPVFLVEAEENSNSQQWESMVWDQRKNYSSEGSPSPEHFEFSAMWNARENSLTDDKPVAENWGPWNRQVKCFASDSFEEERISVASEELLRSPDWCDRKSDGSSCRTSNTYFVDCKKDENSVVSSNDLGENAVKKCISAEAIEPGYVRAALIFGDLCKTATPITESMDILSESKKDGDEDQEENGSSDEKDTVKNEVSESSNVGQEVHPVALILSPSLIAEEQTTIIRRKNSTAPPTPCENSYSHKTTHRSDTIFHEKQEEERPTENRKEQYGVIRHEAHVNYSEVSSIRAELTDHLGSISSIEEHSDNAYENCNCICTDQKSVGETAKKESEKYWNFDKTPVASPNPTIAPIDASKCRREPTLQTTPITVTTCQQPRCFERLIINEETLNKIVVPTACTGDSAKSSMSNNTDSIARDYSHDCNRNRRTNNRYDFNRQAEDRREQVVKKIDSPSKNVFVKTKRIIFSPFRRAEDRQGSKKDPEDSDVECALRPKCKSKSRSASPKISRQDALLRVPLSLPWPLRSGSKDREVKIDRKSVDTQGSENIEKISTETSHKAANSAQSATLKEATRTLAINASSNSSTYSDRRVSYFPERKLSMETAIQTNMSQNLLSHERQCGSAIALSSTSPQNRTSTQTCPSSSTSPGFDPLSSDLMHKLRILSNVAARRDGRTNTISTDRVSESHSARIRRAKESFFSCSGGPLYGSTLDSFGNMPETSTCRFEGIKKDIAETTKIKDPPREDEEVVATTLDNQGAEEKLNEERNSSLNENRLTNSRSSFRSSEASTGSPSDLVKSASAGMINVDPDTFGRLATSNRGCESLPRTITKRRDTSGPFARIVNKFKLSRLIRGKESEASGMSTISTLCRQSLLIDVQTDFEEHRENEEQNEREGRQQEEDNSDMDLADRKK